ncbi:hypothetical protein VNO77_41847 [Canavalia gladiata]|uniref:Uncharacterized protein n=1 Tax=Canavalia gladiata TaxID=3824 RepID=A0AAN9JZ70_CANGL
MSWWVGSRSLKIQSLHYPNSLHIADPFAGYLSVCDVERGSERERERSKKKVHRTIALRDSSEEGAVDLRDAASKREKNLDTNKDWTSRSKRRKSFKSLRGISKIRFSNATSFASNQNHRRSFTPARPPSFKVTEEVIDMMVPRKVHSVSLKRSRESEVSASNGTGSEEDQNFRQRSNFPGGQEPASPPFSSVPAQKKMLVIKSVPKTLKSSL